MTKTVPVNGKRLCHVITTPTDQYSSGLRTRMEAEIALRLGFEVDIVTGLGPADQQLISHGLPGVTYWRLPSLTKYIYPQRDLLAVWQLYTLFRRRGYDVVHTHLAKAGVVGRLAAGWAKVPTIIHDVHGPTFTPAHNWTRRQLYVTLERLAGRSTTHYVFYTQHLKNDFAAYGIGKEAVKKVIYPNLNLEQYLAASPLTADQRQRLRAPWGLAPDHLVLGFVARLVPSKGHHFLIKALPQVLARWPQVRVLFVGGAIWPEEQEYLQHLQQLLKTLALTDKVFFTGHQIEMLPFYQIFDLFVSPSLYEGTANATLEALSTGLPVVAFDLPFVHEICPPEVITCPVGSVAGLAAGIERALSCYVTAPDAIRPSWAFRQELVKKFSGAQWRTNIENLYREIMATNSTQQICP
jgi:glycosyltransferase involved in cell wall biosynthesis